MEPRIILASSSKARSRILSQCKIPHRIVVSHIEETQDDKKGPISSTITNANKKAEVVSKKFAAGFVIGLDTLVLLGKRLIGKPKNKLQAKKLLKEFSGKTILVYTGICIKDIGKNKTVKAVTISKVKVRELTPREVDKFYKLLGPFDKAGGFSIEGVGSFIFDNIEGSFYNVVGLPTITLYKLFKKLGVDLLKYIAKYGS